MSHHILARSSPLPLKTRIGIIFPLITLDTSLQAWKEEQLRLQFSRSIESCLDHAERPIKDVLFIDAEGKGEDLPSSSKARVVIMLDSTSKAILKLVERANVEVLQQKRITDDPQSHSV